MYLISKFMHNFSYKYDEVIKLNWFTFNELLRSLNIVEAEQDYRNLVIADNHINTQLKDSSKFSDLYKRLEAKTKDGVKYDTSKADIKRLFQDLGGGK